MNIYKITIQEYSCGPDIAEYTGTLKEVRKWFCEEGWYDKIYHMYNRSHRIYKKVGSEWKEYGIGIFDIHDE